MKQLPRNIIFILVFILILSILANIFVMASNSKGISGKATAASGQVSFFNNHPPVLVQNIPNYTWPRFTSKQGPVLNEYFEDPDGDELNYSNTDMDYIEVTYFSDTSTLFSPVGYWWGVETVRFIARDPYGETAVSNLVYLNITYKDFPQPTAEDSGGGGGGGTPRNVDYVCVPNWKCTPWSECIGGSQVRSCIDINYCGINDSKPETKRSCTTASCYDDVQNCHDGSCEEGIDCGGPCTPCPTCFDEIQNCHDGSCEEGIDCGGPCIPCGLKTVKELQFIKSPWMALLFLLIAIIIIESYLFYLIKKHKHKLEKL